MLFGLGEMMTREEAIAAIKQIERAEGGEKVIDSLARRLTDECWESYISDLIFWDPVQRSAEDIVDEAIRRCALARSNPEVLTREQAVDVVGRLLRKEYPESDVPKAIFDLLLAFPDSGISELILWESAGRTAEEIVNEAIRQVKQAKAKPDLRPEIIASVMPKLFCRCGEIIEQTALPHPNHWLMINDVFFSEAFHGMVDSDSVYGTMLRGVRCGRCGRLWIFWRGGQNAPTCYAIEDESK